jgi:hypothetical protein
MATSQEVEALQRSNGRLKATVQRLKRAEIDARVAGLKAEDLQKVRRACMRVSAHALFAVLGMREVSHFTVPTLLVRTHACHACVRKLSYNLLLPSSSEAS